MKGDELPPTLARRSVHGLIVGPQLRVGDPSAPPPWDRGSLSTRAERPQQPRSGARARTRPTNRTSSAASTNARAAGGRGVEATTLASDRDGPDALLLRSSQPPITTASQLVDVAVSDPVLILGIKEKTAMVMTTAAVPLPHMRRVDGMRGGRGHASERPHEAGVEDKGGAGAMTPAASAACSGPAADVAAGGLGSVSRVRHWASRRGVRPPQPRAAAQ
jgi:hypothetical protein